MVQDSRGSYQKFRALLDSAAETTLITEKCVQSLKLPRNHACVNIKGLGSISAGRTKGSVQLYIRAPDKFSLSLTALIMKNLTSDLPPITVDISNYQKIHSLQLADPHFNQSGSVDVILGADIFIKLLRPEKFQLDDDLFAQNTCFGYVISGKSCFNIGQDQEPVTSYGTIMTCHVDLHDTIQKFWEVEGIESPEITPDHWCETHFRENTFKDRESGKYVVRLPFKENTPDLGDSLSTAIQRLFAMERRFHKFPELKKEYARFMREYLELGNMSLIPHNEIKGVTTTTFYLPHHAVMKESSSTTRLRVVFDGSAKCATGVSLNDKLAPGPPILQELFSILVRFRKHKIALVADVEKMFRQVLVHKDDRNYQRIVWRENANGPILHYRLNTVTYGTACATFLAARTLHQIADDLPSDFFDVKHIIRSDFYVDDLLSGCANVNEAKNLQSRIVEGLNSGGFKLRKWVSNSEELLSSIPVQDRETLIEFDDGETFVKTLGLVWMTHLDCFTFKISMIDYCPPITKRKFLSITGRVFDPLGFLSPCTIVAKILFQKLWLHKLDWDDPLPEKMELEWNKLHLNFILFEKVQIPRFLNIPSSPVELELHGFSDASEMAYAAVVYLRTVDKDGVSSVRIIAAKTKVSPLKQICLPRLELCAAVLLVKLLCKLSHSLDIPNLQMFGWTDSTIVLAWLSDVPRRWKTFIANRTSFILEKLPRLNWEHVPSKKNPADLASRGASPDQLVDNQLWWKGPDFLRESSDKWPKLADSQFQSVAFDDLETKATFIYTAAAEVVPSDFTVVANLFKKSSSFSHVIRIIAQCYRFYDKFKTKPFSLYLTASQIQRATTFAVRWSQGESYAEDIYRITKGSDLRRDSKLRSLAPFVDDRGVLRVGGRIGLTTCCSYNTKHPAILDARHQFTETLTKMLHARHLHPTQQQLLTIIRQNYFVIGAKNLIKRVAHYCVTCSRHRLRTSQQQMGNLPSYRITPSRPFSNVGVDFAGPIKVKSKTGRGAKIYKGYIAVFICLPSSRE